MKKLLVVSVFAFLSTHAAGAYQGDYSEYLSSGLPYDAADTAVSQESLDYVHAKITEAHLNTCNALPDPTVMSRKDKASIWDYLADVEPSHDKIGYFEYVQGNRSTRKSGDIGYYQGYNNSLYACVDENNKPVPYVPLTDDNGITDQEIHALTDYTSFGFGWLNSFLRSPKAYLAGDESPNKDVLDQGGEAMLRLLTSALQKAPKYNGVTYRCDSKKHSLKVKDQQTYAPKAFMSTSIAKHELFCEQWANDAKKCDLIFAVHGISGVHIEAISTRAFEQEVLFLPKTKFNVHKPFMGKIPSCPEMKTTLVIPLYEY